MAQARVPVLFAVSRYLRYKHFDVVRGYRPPRELPQNQSFERLHLRCQFFFDISSRCFVDEYFDIVWGCHSPGTLSIPTPPKNQIFDWLKLGH